MDVRTAARELEWAAWLALVDSDHAEADVGAAQAAGLLDADGASTALGNELEAHVRGLRDALPPDSRVSMTPSGIVDPGGKLRELGVVTGPPVRLAVLGRAVPLVDGEPPLTWHAPGWLDPGRG